jgi:alkylation response protein AidB-like acyl-CoA dehydrogenase
VPGTPTLPLLDRARALGAELAASAAERDRRGGVPLEERQLLRQSGLLSISIERELGGEGASIRDILESVRIIARADASLAHVYAYHHLLLVTVGLFGTREQYVRWARPTLAQRWLWGNALNPRDRRTVGTLHGDAYVVEGEKSFATGARDADVLVVSFLEASTETLRVAVVSTDTPGINARGDWDAFGQRQTDSGTVEFRRVRVLRRDVLVEPGPLGSVRASLRPLLAQLSLTAIYVGLAEGALVSSRDAARERGPADDLGLALAGELQADLDSAGALFDRAATALDRAFSRADALEPHERGEVALVAAAAKSVATRRGLDVATRAIELAGARAVGRSRALDRFWRDLRVHTLHDPLAYKHRDLGRWLLEGVIPTPSFYS